ncbi:Uncharacterized protein APZ42_024395 [Daphnia magna]|uniref:Uncharacterized protein n=1 Tax=Daphnia magna TaxID=35525 RepID=A0A164U2J9_9CRUS|nr:Uncharacterized protein APZ42_024395 [Daphnia magna]
MQFPRQFRFAAHFGIKNCPMSLMNFTGNLTTIIFDSECKRKSL